MKKLFENRIKGCGINAVIYSNNKKILDTIMRFFRAHNQRNRIAHGGNVKKIIVMNVAEQEYVLEYNGEIDNRLSIFEVLGKVAEILYNNLLNEEYIYLHGGMVSKEKMCLAFVGPSNIGKTTLVMNMLSKGYHYRTDDIIPISRENYMSHVFPKPIFLRRDSPYIKQASGIIKNGNYIRKAVFPKSIDYQPCKISFIVILNRKIRFAGKSSYEELFGREKLRIMLYNIYEYDKIEKIVIDVAKILSETKVYRMNYYSLIEAETCLKGMIEECGITV